MQISFLQSSTAALNTEEQRWMEAATQALSKSYSPYSSFKVGCAIALENGAVVSGANQENAAYPQCLCAEQVALGAVASQFPGLAIRAIFITASKLDSRQVLAPCGQCRQTILEFENRQQQPIRILMMKGEEQVVSVESAASLLPFAFSASHL